MSEVNSRQSQSNGLQRYWENPHPYGLVAMLKSAIYGMRDAVDGSIAATSPPPSTEEEAFQHDQRRIRGITGAFDAVSRLGPSAPASLGPGIIRVLPKTIEGQLPHHLPRLRNGSSGSVPSVPPPTGEIAPTSGLLSRLREAEALERQLAIGNSGRRAPGSNDSNFRQLSRLAPGLFDTVEALNRIPAIETQRESDAVKSGGGNIAELERPVKKDEMSKPPRGSGGGGQGGGRGGSGSGGGGQDEEEPCDERQLKEIAECYEGYNDRIHNDYPKGCEERAKDRYSWCLRYGIDHPGGPTKWVKWNQDKHGGDEETWRNYGR